MAAAIARPVSTVGSWHARGSIPDDAKPLILQRSDELGFGLTRDDFFPLRTPEKDVA